MIGLQEAGTVDGGGGGATVELDILDTDSTGVDVRQETVLPRFVAPEQWVLQVLYAHGRNKSFIFTSSKAMK